MLVGKARIRHAFIKSINMHIPEDIVRHIVKLADVPIDTKLAFGVAGRLKLDTQLVELLDNVNHNKMGFILTGDTTVYVRKLVKGCKRREFRLRLNRYPDHNQVVLVKDYLKRNVWMETTWVSW